MTYVKARYADLTWQDVFSSVAKLFVANVSLSADCISRESHSTTKVHCVMNFPDRRLESQMFSNSYVVISRTLKIVSLDTCMYS